MATIPKILAMQCRHRTNLKTTFIADGTHEICIARRQFTDWHITLIADSRSDLVYVYYRHEDTDFAQDVSTFDDALSVITDHSLFGQLVTKHRFDGDKETQADHLCKQYDQLPWEQSVYGISVVGYMHEGHSLICEECAIEEYFSNPGSIELVDATHTPHFECQHNNPCGNWVGGKCSTEGCSNPIDEEEHPLCYHCANSGMPYPHHTADPSAVLDAMQAFLTSYLSSNEEYEETIDELVADCVVYDASDMIRWPESLDDYALDNFEDDWNEYWMQTAVVGGE